MGFYQLPKIIGKDKKPPFGARINWHHPLSQGLVGAWLFNEGNGKRVFDIVNGMNNTTDIDNNYSWSYSLLYNSSIASSIAIPHKADFQNLDPISIFVLLIPTGDVNGGYYITKLKSAAGVVYGYALRFYFGRVGFVDNNSALFWGQTGITVYAYQLQAVSVSADSSGRSIYSQGKLVNSDSTPYGGSTCYDRDLYIAGSYNIYDSATGYYFCTYMWNRRLTDQEHLSLFVNPYQMFLPVVWDAYFVPAAAPPPTGGRSIFGYDSIFHAGGIIQT